MANRDNTLPTVKNRCAHRRSAGFTLAELLCVLAIIGLLLALTLPAIQGARESARLVDCKNRLRQVGLGLRNYHDANKRFPGGVALKDKGMCLQYETRLGMAWSVAILPFIEEVPLFSQYNDKLYNEAPDNAAVRTAYVEPYICPGDPFANQKVVPAEGPVAPKDKANLEYRTGSYRGVSGVSDGLRYFDSDINLGYEERDRGMLHVVVANSPRMSPEKFSRITDGLTNTLMVGESITRTQPDMHTLWAYSHEFYTLSAFTLQDRAFLGDYEKCEAIFGKGREKPCQRGWGSSHPHLLNYVYGDGSVHSIRDTVSTKVLWQMATIAGQELTSRPE